MSFLQQALRNPRRLWLRRAVFHVHLWAGVLLALYVVVIALTGSVLVFQQELTGLTLPPCIARQLPPAPADLPAIVARVEQAYPGAAIDNLIVPTAKIPAYRLLLRFPDRHTASLLADSATGRLCPAPRTWVDRVHDLHVRLLLSPDTGLRINAICAGILLLLVATGLMLWWRGLRTWRRGLRIDPRARWPRLHYDLHSALGFWTLAIVFWWSLSGLYFGFYQPVSAAINAVFPLRNMHAPVPLPAAPGDTRVPLSTLLAAAQQASPHARLSSLSNATRKAKTVYILMDLGQPGDFLHRDIVCLDATNARVLSVWHYAEKHSLGDWIVWLMHPLHFGTQWGLAIKIVWALLGLTLAALAITGLLLYWNRYLRRLGPRH